MQTVRHGQEKAGVRSWAFLSEWIDIRTKLSDICPCKRGVPMDKRDRFIAEIRSEARAMGLSFRVDYPQGQRWSRRDLCWRQTHHAAEQGNRSQNRPQDQEAFGTS